MAFQVFIAAHGVYITTRDKNRKFMTDLWAIYTGRRWKTRNVMAACSPIRRKSSTAIAPRVRSREHVREKKYYSCHQCDQWPCSMIENFGLATGLRVMKEPFRCGGPGWPNWGMRKVVWNGQSGVGTLSSCPVCGKPLF